MQTADVSVGNCDQVLIGQPRQRLLELTGGGGDDLGETAEGKRGAPSVRDADRSDHRQLDRAVIVDALSDLVADDVAESAPPTQQVRELQRQPIATLVRLPPMRLPGGTTLEQPLVDAAR